MDLNWLNKNHDFISEKMEYDAYFYLGFYLNQSSPDPGCLDRL